MATRKKVTTEQAQTEVPTVTDQSDALKERNARIQALMIVLGLISRNYAKQHIEKFLTECLELNLVEELIQAQRAGESYFEKRVPAESYDKLLQYLGKAEGISGETDAR